MISHYISSFLRGIRRNRFFHAVNLFGFITGFLVITVILIYVSREVSVDRFNKNASEIVRLHPSEYGVTPQCFAAKLRNQIPEIKGIVRFSSMNMTVADSSKEINIGNVYYTDSDVFNVFSFSLLSGNPENILDIPYSIVIDKSTAGKLFGNSPPEGRIIKSKDGSIYTVTGIMEDIPSGSHLRGSAFISFGTMNSREGIKETDCSTWSVMTYLRLADKADKEETVKKINFLLDDFLMKNGNNKIPLQLEPLRKIYFDGQNNKYDGCRHGSRQNIILYLAIAFLVLINVIINYVNLSTAIAADRVKETAIRKINGAERVQIIKQVMTESLGIALFSYMIAVLIIILLLPRISTLLNIPLEGKAGITGLIFYGFAGVIMTGLITGFFPGLYISGISDTDALKNETLFKTGGYSRKIMLTFQLLIMAVLLNSVFIMSRQINYVINKDVGFNFQNVISIHMDKGLAEKKEILRNNLSGNPDIKNLAFSSELIGEGFGKKWIKTDGNEILCNFLSAEPGYIGLYGIQLSSGRDFSWETKTDITGSCMINETACKAFGIENPIGKSLNNRIITGIVKDFNFTSLYNPIEPLVIYCGTGNIAQIKIPGKERTGTLEYITKICDEISPDKERSFSFMDDRLKLLYKPDIDLKGSFTVYSMIALLIVLLGLFSLNVYLMRKKTKEICIRKLFGAKLKDTFEILLSGTFLLIIVSNIIAVPVTFLLMNRWLKNYAFRTDINILVFCKTLLITAFLIVLSSFFIILRTYKARIADVLKYQ